MHRVQLCQISFCIQQDFKCLPFKNRRSLYSCRVDKVDMKSSECKCLRPGKVSAQRNCTYLFHYQSVCGQPKSGRTRKRAINVTSLHRQILFGGTSFVTCNHHILKYIVFDWKAGVCSCSINNERSLILVLWCSILNHVSAGLLYGGLEALILFNSDRSWHTRGLPRPS